MTFVLISIWGLMLFMIILVLDLFKFTVTLNSFTRFPSYTNFIFATALCCYSLAAGISSCCYSLASSSACFSLMSFNLSGPYFILSITLLYNKKAVSRTLCSLSACASRVLIQRCIILKLYFSKMNSSFIKYFWQIFFKFYGQEKTICVLRWSVICLSMSGYIGTALSYTFGPGQGSNFILLDGDFITKKPMKTY